MAHNRFKIRRARKINDIYDQYSRTGIPNSVIFKEHIEKQFDISLRTFYRILKMTDL